MTIPELHALYCRITGFDIRLDPNRESQWFYWSKAGFNERDLVDMVAFLRKAIANNERKPASLYFRNLIGQPDYFEEDLAGLRARQRARPVDPARVEALRATGRDPAPPTPPARPAKELLQQQIAALRAAVDAS